MSGSITVKSTSAIDLGSSSKAWNNIYANTFNGAMSHYIDIGGKQYNGSTDVTIYASDLGVSSALNFAGIISETLPNMHDAGYPSTTDVHLYSNGSLVTKASGTVVICHDTQDEFLWSEDASGNAAWYSLGLASSFALHNHTHGNILNNGTMASPISINNVSTSSASKAIVTDSNSNITIEDLTVSDPSVINNANATSFISSISQSSTGKITAVKSNISDVYVYNTGDTMTGPLSIHSTDGSYLQIKNSTTDVSLYLQVATDGPTVMYSDGYWNGSTKIADAQWLVYRDTNGNIGLNGNANTATSAGKWTTARTLTIGNLGKTVDGSANVSWDLHNILIRASNEVNFTANGIADLWINYKTQTGTSAATKITGYHFGNGQGGIGGVNLYAETFNGNLNGNASTATKATQDGSGNVITSTYVKKTGDTMTGNLIMYTSSNGASPAIIFQRGTFTDDYNDWRIQDSGGLLYFGQRGSGSSDFDSTIYFNNAGEIHATKVWGAVWNDYAEYRKDNAKEKDVQIPGKCVREVGDGSLALTTKRLERGCEIISDTFGFAIGQDEENGYNTPIASNGRVLAYPYESIEEFASHIGYPVCSGPDGTVSIMTDEEEEKYPSRIIGTISEIPSYEEWGTGKVKVNGRVWIRIK